MCAEQELEVGNSWFKKMDVYQYTWLRTAEGRVVDKALIDYVLPKRMLGTLLNNADHQHSNLLSLHSSKR